MRLGKLFGGKREGREGTLEERTALIEARDESGASRRPAAPARTTLAIPALASSQGTGGPTRPEVDGARRTSRRANGKAMTPGRAHAPVRDSQAAMNTLHPVAHPAPGLPVMPDTLRGMSSEAGLRDTLRRLFGSDAQAAALANRILAAVPPSDDRAEGRYLAPLMLATAMKSIGIVTDEACAFLLDTAARGEHDPTLFRLERVLAHSAPGAEALARLRQMTDQPARLEALRDGLRLSADLEAKGFQVDGLASVAALASALRAMPDLPLERSVGRDDDPPLQLLAQALVHVDRMARGEPFADSPQRAAYVAWKKGGFTQSGAGTDFNLTLERLHKFATYVDRADHGPRTVANLLRDAAAWAGRTVGIGKSPLTPMRLGTQGADLGLLHEEAAKYERALHAALGTAVDHLVDTLRDPAVQGAPAERHASLARAAAFHLWRANDRPKFALAAVVAHARRLDEESGGAPGGFDERALQRALRGFTSRARMDDGTPGVRVTLATLEAVGTGRRHRHGAAQGAAFNPLGLRAQICRLRNVGQRTEAQEAQLRTLQGQRREHIAAMLKELRGISRGGDKPIELFRFSDLKRLLRGSPRAGPNAASAQRVMNALASARYESMSTFGDGTSRGAGLFGAVLLQAGSKLGIPLAYPVFSAEVGHRATVTVGVSNTGGRIVIGTEDSHGVSAGAGGGWAFPTWLKRLSVAGLGEIAGAYNRSEAAGATITTRNDLEGWHEKLPQVIDFLFDEARRPVGAGSQARSADPSTLWCRFADRFGEDPHIAVGWVRESSRGLGAKATATAVARVVVNERTSIGPAFTGSIAGSAGRSTRTPAADGTDVPTAVRQWRAVAGASASLTQTAPPVATDNDTATGWGVAVPLVGASLEWNLAGALGVARLGRSREGQLSPGLCHRELIFQQPDSLIAYANLHRDTWEAAMVAKDPTGATTPDNARRRFNEFLQQVADTPRRADRLFGEQMTLHPAVAERINRYEARLNALLGCGDRIAMARELSASERTECHALQDEAHRLLQSDESWEHAGIYAVEINQQGDTTGLNFGLRSVNVEQARAARLTSLLIAGVPAGADRG